MANHQTYLTYLQPLMYLGHLGDCYKCCQVNKVMCEFADVVAGHSKASYLCEAAKAVFANDNNTDVQHLSQVYPDLFEGKVLWRIKE